MVRLLAAILMTCFFTAQLRAQATKDEAPKDQPLAAQTPAPSSPASPSAKTGFPFDAFPEFSAVMAGSMSPNDTRESYIYRSGNLIRNEGLGDHSYLITNLATHESFGVTTTGCIHDSHPYFRSAPLASIAPGDKAVRVDAGEETIDGHSCKIEDV